MIEVDKYNRENTNADFNSDLVVEGVVLELQSLSSLLKNLNFHQKLKKID